MDGAAPAALLPAKLGAQSAFDNAVLGIDSQGLRAKARSRPRLAPGTQPKSRCRPSCSSASTVPMVDAPSPNDDEESLCGGESKSAGAGEGRSDQAGEIIV